MPSKIVLQLSTSAVLLSLAGCGEEELLYKAARSAIEDRLQCGKPMDFTAQLAKDLAAMDVLTCGTARLESCAPKGAFTNAVQIQERRDPLFGQSMGAGYPRQIMICGKAKIEKFTGKRVSETSPLSATRQQAEVDYVVTPELSDNFKKQPQAKDVLAKLGSPVTFSSVIVMESDGTNWRRR